ncbi:UDP-glucosyltransferase A1 [Colletotrichum orbiculare MAFF 240422]|uniref:UDP-glucosyltransferase A1 n=1 Tax=Colletotrichum orbiculare (strain 104-T / ATCC 96160 / CBS 514.97 / LARS 414 / MAFF 240422) TaxID=1213857 RepID=A0A484G5J8_COLOR|nr:UDP-glucosyltransferase A1 [Colletotrichum orbiculare MAFF 240422]
MANTTQSVSPNGHSQKPAIVMMAIPTYGHTLPLLKICSHLSARGYPVVFIGGAEHQAQIRRAGATYVEHPPWGITDDFKAARDKIANVFRRNTFEAEQVYVGSMRQRHRVLRSTLEVVRRRHPDRDVVVVHECISAFATLPFFYGAPLPAGYGKLPKVVNVPIYPLFVWSVDTPLFGPGDPPTTTLLGRLRNLVLYYIVICLPMYWRILGRVNQEMKALGATRRVVDWLPDVVTTTADEVLMVCSQSMDYPRSDLNPKIRFIGCLPNNASTTSFRPDFEPPTWWSIIEENSKLPADARKRVVMATQGTLSIDYNDLLVPLMRALSGRQDVLVIAVLGGRDKKLPQDFAVPANAYVAPYLPYEAILPLCDVSVQNGGYGGWTQAVMYGVPTILAGATEEKRENVMRGQWTGTSVGIKKRRPSVEELRLAVATVLGDYHRYKKRVMELKAENERLDAMAQVEACIERGITR